MATNAMTSKERVRAAIHHQEPDRVPINYYGNADINRRLKDHYRTDNLLEALGVDFRGVGPKYAGPRLHEDKGPVRVDNWGIHRRWVEHETGGYWDYCEWPLSDATEEKMHAWPMPDPEAYDYSGIEEACDRYATFCITAGGAGLPDIINGCGMLRTMEQILVDLITNDPAGMALIDRRNTIQFEITRRTLEAANGKIDLLCLGEDLGTQRGPTISPKLFGRHIRPRIQMYVDLAGEYGIPTMIHSCGSSSWAFDDFIEMGIRVVETLQPEAQRMEPGYLKETYGQDLAFHGCISTAGPLAYGTPREVEDIVQEVLEVMMPGGGYILAPTHSIQDNSPTENVVTMYEAAATHGRYG